MTGLLAALAEGEPAGFSIGPLLVGVLLLLANGFFVAGEFALLASRRSRLEQLNDEGRPGAKQALAGLRELSLMLAGAQLGITMASLALGAITEPALAGGLALLLGDAVPEAALHPIAFTIALSIVVFLHMVVGEMMPKSVAITDPERAALLLSRPFRAFTLLFRPFIGLLNFLANGLVRLAGVEPQDELAAAHAPADLLMLVRESAEHGTLATDQQGLLERALHVSGLDAEAAMVPRRDIVAVAADATMEDIERTASETGRSRLPVYDGELDRVRGVVHVKDLLALDSARRDDTRAGDLARPAFVTVESRPIEDLMLEMREARAHIALVVDEFGSVSGLVALEDLIEELIGDFEDETDAPGRRRTSSTAALSPGPTGTYLIPGTLRPDELHDRTGLRLPEGDYETVAGYVISCLGRVPEPGDVVDSPVGRLEVLDMDGTRVAQLVLHPVTGLQERAES